jgi:hypothetical protein
MRCNSTPSPDCGKSSLLCGLFLAVLLFFSGGSAVISAQQSCGTDALHEALLENSSDYARSWFAFEAAMSTHQSARSVLDGIVTIPTVIHVMHDGTAEGVGGNVDFEQVLSAIDALNADFSGAPGGADVEVQFCLASRTPEGNPTNGVVRVDVSSTFSGYPQTGLITSPGGGSPSEWDLKTLSNWPGADYLNIWVVPQMNSGGNPLGFAYLPPITGMLDGVVLRADVFGVGEDFDLHSSANLNRTLTHEVGHYLGLYHTFNATASCASVENDCNVSGDRVCDTPPTTTGWGCSAGCPAGMAENFMDYTSDACMSAFTEGQRDRMRAAIAEHRTSLVTSMGCVAPSAFDIGAVAITAPGTSTCQPNVSADVEIFNFGTDVITSTSIAFQLNDGEVNTFEWTGSLEPGASTLATLPTMSAGYGSHELSIWTSLPNGNEDGYTGNNDIVHAFTVAPGDEITFTLHTDASPMETAWTLINDSTGEVFLSGDSYSNASDANQTFSYGGCAVSGCYTLMLTDLFSDGLGLWPNGWYTLTLSDGSILAEGSGNFGASATHNICFDGTEFSDCEDLNGNDICDEDEPGEGEGEGETTDPVIGCTEASACNFSATATEDSGNCIFAAAGLDCYGNPAAAYDGMTEGPSGNGEGELDGVSDLELASSQWSLAPNPTASGQLTALGLPATGRYALVVMDATGRLIAKNTLEALPFGGGARIDWTGWTLPAGCYLIGLFPASRPGSHLPFQRLTIR